VCTEALLALVVADGLGNAIAHRAQCGGIYTGMDGHNGSYCPEGACTGSTPGLVLTWEMVDMQACECARKEMRNEATVERSEFFVL
jgi:hypothetical protein